MAEADVIHLGSGAPCLGVLRAVRFGFFVCFILYIHMEISICYIHMDISYLVDEWEIDMCMRVRGWITSKSEELEVLAVAAACAAVYTCMHAAALQAMVPQLQLHDCAPRPENTTQKRAQAPRHSGHPIRRTPVAAAVPACAMLTS